MTRLLAAAAALIALLALQPGAGAKGPGQVFHPAGEEGLSRGWELKVKEGRPETFLRAGDDVKALCLVSDSASFSIQKEVDVDVSKYPYLSWKWMVNRFPEGADVRKRGGDDQAAQLFVAFEGRKSISYIWDTEAPAGTRDSSWIPAVISIKTLVVASGDGRKDEWVVLVRNVYEDYRKFFGTEPPRAKGIRYQINSQHTGTQAQSCLEYVRFTEKPPL